HEDTNSKGIRIHAKEKISPSVDGEMKPVWEFENREILMRPVDMILVRVLIGKVKDMGRTVGILEGVPMRGGQDGWNCVGWVKEGVEALVRDGKALGRCAQAAMGVDWVSLRDAAMEYVHRKEAEHRFDGKAQEGLFDSSKVPTYDLLEGSETIP
ncbi:hypothetical protein H0H93_002665, partial [Arthromyces matolae]